MDNDPVNHPSHYTSHPSGIECIQVTEYMGFCIGNAIKYLWRADLKNGLEDLKKAAWYINREIEKREKISNPVVAGHKEGSTVIVPGFKDAIIAEMHSMYPKYYTADIQHEKEKS